MLYNNALILQYMTVQYYLLIAWVTSNRDPYWDVLTLV